MGALLDNAGAIVSGFGLTLRLLVTAAFFATVVGTVLAVMRVGPIAALRVFSARYIDLVRNTRSCWCSSSSATASRTSALSCPTSSVRSPR
jgi:ABC-type amino acid transport system permease subunit